MTRDRIHAQSDHFGQPFIAIDAGGIATGVRSEMQDAIAVQTQRAIDEADILVMVVDAQVGVTTSDERVAEILRKAKKPLLLAVNKVDDRSQLDALHAFRSLGIPCMVGVSALHNFQVVELLHEALERGEKRSALLEEGPSVRVAIVGRANVGKSTLVNALLKEERCTVSALPGTTRDSIDTHIKVGDDSFILMDTAGLRRKKSEKESVEKFAAIRTEEAIERADICVLVVDGVRGLTSFEKRIAEHLEQKGKGCVLVFNKWDLVKGVRTEHCEKSLSFDVPFLEYCPKLFLSGLTGRSLEKVFPAIKQVHAALQKRITTGQLNRFLEKAMQTYSPPMISGKRFRIYYLSQIDIAPPRFVLFVNNATLMPEAYRKYLIHQFRNAYGFEGVPLQFFLRSKKHALNKAKRSGEIVHGI